MAIQGSCSLLTRYNLAGNCREKTELCYSADAESLIQAFQEFIKGSQTKEFPQEIRCAIETLNEEGKLDTPQVARIIKLCVETYPQVVNTKKNISIQNNLVTLFHSMTRTSYESAKILLASGIDLNPAEMGKGRGKSVDLPLLLAAQQGATEVVRILLDYGANIHYAAPRAKYGEEGFTALHYAIKNRDKAMIALLLERGSSLDTPDRAGNTPLHLATKMQDLELVSLLLKMGAKTDMKNRDGKTPLFLSQGNRAIDTLLIERGANLNDADAKGKTILINVLEKLPPDKDYVIFLVEKGASLENSDSDGNTPLSIAVGNLCINIDLIRFLLEKGAAKSLNEHSKPLIEAIAKRRADVAALLLSHGANPDFFDSKTRRGTLETAIQTKDIELVRLLIEQGAHINAPHHAALFQAIKNDSPEIALLLIEKGADPTHSFYSDNLLSLVVEKKYASLATLFLERGIDVNLPLANPPLLQAIKSQQTELAKEILRFKPNLNLTNFEDDNALSLAIKKKEPELVGLLIENGSDPECVDRNGDTPLMLAIKTQQYSLIDLLQKKNINKENKQGKTALCLACEYHAPLTVLIKLLDLGANDQRGNLALLQKAIEAAIYQKEEKDEYARLILSLKDKGAYFEPLDHETVSNAIYSSVKKGIGKEAEIDVIKLLILAGAQIHAEIMNGRDSIATWVKGRALPIELPVQVSHDTMKAASAIRWAAHIFAKEGIIHWSGKKIDAEGFHKEIVAKKTARSLEKFSQKCPTLVSHDLAAEFTAGMYLAANHRKVGADQYLERIASGKPTFLLTGSLDHAVAILVWGDLMVICDRAKVCNPYSTLTVGQFDPSKMDEHFIQKTLGLGRQTMDALEKATREYDENSLLGQIGFKIKRGSSLESLAALPQQRVGNCTFASAEGILKVFLALATVTPEKALTMSYTEQYDAAKAIDASFQGWTFFNKISGLKNVKKKADISGLAPFKSDISMLAGQLASHNLPEALMCMARKHIT